MFGRKKNVYGIDDLKNISDTIDTSLRAILEKDAAEVEEESNIIHKFLAESKKFGDTKRHAEKEMLEEMTNLKKAISSDIIFHPERTYPEIFSILNKISEHGQRFGFAIKIFIDLIEHQIINLQQFENSERETPLSAKDQIGIQEEREVLQEMRSEVFVWIEGIREKSNSMRDLLSKTVLEQSMAIKEIPEKKIREFFFHYDEIQKTEEKLKLELEILQKRFSSLSRDLNRELKILKKSLRNQSMIHNIAAGYREINERHPKVIYGVGITFLILGTAGAVFALPAAGGIAAFFGGGSMIGFLTSTGFTLITGVMYAFIVDWGPKLGTKIANAT